MNRVSEEQTDRALARALVIDDDRMNRRVAERMLCHLDCAVVTAGDAGAGAEVLKSDPIDIVFTDVEMPDMDGDEAIALFRTTAAAGPGKRERPLVVVAVSGEALGPDRTSYLQVGFDDYIPKPVSVEAFRDCLDRWVGAGESEP